ncbi:MAG: ChbG/HpnK family deacetylase, partial [Acidobacteria bacterium]|nr:ChbG/HpnK family deacetylase [Acidobacteriota bacterium]
ILQLRNYQITQLPNLMPRLIINADDLGLTPGVNRAVLEAHQRGVVTSATLMANSAAFDDAVRQVQQAPGLSVGCHVLLVDGEPLLEPRPRTLARNGRFRDAISGFALAAMRGRLDPDEITAEVSAQIRKLQAAGLTVSHLDTHKHTHLFPAVLKPLLAAAKACGVRAIRNPFAPLAPLALAHLVQRPKLWTRYSEVRLLRRYAADFRRRVAEAGMATTEGTLGIVVTGRLDAVLFEAIIGAIPEGTSPANTWEFVCHPGYVDADLDGVRTRLRESRQQELDLLTSPAARKTIEARGIELISYRDLGK